MTLVAANDGKRGTMIDEELTAQIAALNAWDAPQIGHRYQRELLSTGTLTLGTTVRRYTTVAFAPDQYLLRPLDGRGPILVTDQCWPEGWRITGAVVDGVVWQASPGREPARMDRESRLLSQSSALTAPLDPDVSPSVAIGHWNFAHLLWNTLPATLLWEQSLAELAAAGAITCAFAARSAEQTRSLAPDSELLPALAPHLRDELSDPPPQGTVRLGSNTVSVEARSRVMESLARVPVGPTRTPRLWLNLMDPNDARSPRNLTDLHIAVIDRWLGATDGDVVIDGFTLPPGPAPGDWHLPRQRRITERIELTLASVRDIRRVSTTDGMSLRDAVALGRTADFYVSCMGTVQHKIGWVWAPPGLVLVPPGPNRAGAAGWHGRLVVGTDEPSTIPDHFVAPTGDAAPSHSAHAPYRIEDVPAAASWIVEHALSTIG